MSYTMTYDASHKVSQGGSHVKGYFRHVAREADLEAGFTFKHSNPNIVRARTVLNETCVNDGEGGYRELRSIDGRPPSDELEDYLSSRLATVTKNLRKDAVVMRPLILQLDPKWFAQNNPDWQQNGLNEEAEEYLGASLGWAEDEFGQQNIVGCSLHLDEYSPQLHVFMTPVTDDGRLSQKDFFKGPAHFKKQRADLLDRMEEEGYDVERRTTSRSTEHLTSSEYQAKADRLRTDETAYKEQWAALNHRSKSIDRRSERVTERENGIEAKERELREREQGLERTRRELQQRMREISRREGLLERLEQASEEHLTALKDMAATHRVALTEQIAKQRAVLSSKTRVRNAVRNLYQEEEPTNESWMEF